MTKPLATAAGELRKVDAVVRESNGATLTPSIDRDRADRQPHQGDLDQSTAARA